MNTNSLENQWMPFTDNRSFLANPRLLASAEGMYFTSVDGRRILDGSAGLWCVNAGHRHPLVTEAICSAANVLDYAPGFQFGHSGAFSLASRLATLFPDGLEKFFFANSGSEAVDSALKIALAYHRSRGNVRKTGFVGRERSYHGVGFGGLSVGGIPGVRNGFGPLLPNVYHMRHTHDPVRNRFASGVVEHGVELAEDLERIVQQNGAETIAAVIVEPVAGSTGLLAPPKGYLARLREIATKHDILLIFDEVITAFGRLGGMTAAERFGVVPEMITFAKGVTNGAVPMGGVAVRNGIYSDVIENAPGGIELAHGYTYSGHPLAAAAALGTLDAYREGRIFDNAARMEPVLSRAAHDLDNARWIADVRSIGLAVAFELVPRDGEPGARGFEALQRCWEAGIMVRVTGDTIVLSPPLVISEEEINQLCAAVAKVLESLR